MRYAFIQVLQCDSFMRILIKHTRNELNDSLFVVKLTHHLEILLNFLTSYLFGVPVVKYMKIFIKNVAECRNTQTPDVILKRVLVNRTAL